METQTLLKHYRMLADHGCRFIRVKANQKRPEGTWGDENGTAWITAEQAVSRLESNTGNVGVVPRDSVFVIDLDGDDAIQRFEHETEENPEVYRTFVVNTPNGLHVYCLANDPDSIHVTVGGTSFGDGVDIRAPGANSQVIGPGSFVENPESSGKNSGYYEVLDDSPIARCPMELEALCRKANKQPPPPPPPHVEPETTETTEKPKPSLKTCRNQILQVIGYYHQCRAVQTKRYVQQAWVSDGIVLGFIIPITSIPIHCWIESAKPLRRRLRMPTMKPNATNISRLPSERFTMAVTTRITTNRTTPTSQTSLLNF